MNGWVALAGFYTREGIADTTKFFADDFFRTSWKLLFYPDPDGNNLAEFCTNPYLSE